MVQLWNIRTYQQELQTEVEGALAHIKDAVRKLKNEPSPPPDVPQIAIETFEPSPLQKIALVQGLFKETQAIVRRNSAST